MVLRPLTQEFYFLLLHYTNILQQFEMHLIVTKQRNGDIKEYPQPTPCFTDFSVVTVLVTGTACCSLSLIG
uniref:Uncharacterized protein n=1 Tax=Rhizophora mucronata TaxID=61149 RepID=A0A2P2QFN5_RHIMU